MDREKLKGEIEAILFAAGEPVALERIAQVLGLRTYAVEELLEELLGRGLHSVSCGGPSRPLQLCDCVTPHDGVRQMETLKWAPPQQSPPKGISRWGPQMESPKLNP